MNKTTQNIVPFKIEFRTDKRDYDTAIDFYMCVWVEKLFIRKAITIEEPRMNFKRYDFDEATAKHRLIRWLYNTYYFYSEVDRWTQFILWFKKEKKVDGAIIKELFGKVFIIELL